LKNEPKEFIKKWWWVGTLTLATAVIPQLILNFSTFWHWAGFQDKTVWDFLELLIVPALIAVSVAYLSIQERKNELIQTEKNNALQRELTDIRLQEERIENYLQKMTDLLTEKSLNRSKAHDPSRVAARSLTGWILARIHHPRRGFILSFLYEAGLLTTHDPKIVAKNINLSQVYLPNTDLNNINLSGAILVKSNFMWSNLKNSNFSHALINESSFFETDFTNCNFKEANLSGAKMKLCNFTNVDFSNANLRGAVLSMANLTNAKISQEQIRQVKLLDGAILPTKYAK
jgi:uncharacterized protein YjbI with pentapeptide repeats